MNCIQLKQGTTALVLQGSGAAAPVKGAVMKPSSLPSSPALLPKGEGSWGNESGGVGSVYEAVLVTLEGTAASIESALQSLARWLVEAEKMARLSGEEPVYLEVQVVSGGTTWRSKVLGGELLLLGAGPDQRSVQRQGVELRLERVSYWEQRGDGAVPEQRRDRAHDGRGDGVQRLGSQQELRAVAGGGRRRGPARAGAPEIEQQERGQRHGVRGAEPEPGPGQPGSDAARGRQRSGERGDGDRHRRGDSQRGVLCAGDVERERDGGGEVWHIEHAGGQLGNWAWLPVMRVHNAIAGGELYWANWRVALTVGGNTDVLLEGRPGYLSNTAVLQPGSPLYLPVWKQRAGTPRLRWTWSWCAAGGSERQPYPGCGLRVPAAAGALAELPRHGELRGGDVPAGCPVPGNHQELPHGAGAPGGRAGAVGGAGEAAALLLLAGRGEPAAASAGPGGEDVLPGKEARLMSFTVIFGRRYLSGGVVAMTAVEMEVELL